MSQDPPALKIVKVCIFSIEGCHWLTAHRGRCLKQAVLQQPVMKINQNTTLTGDLVVLVPYRKEHVEQYHVWMQDPDLQEATASEPLTLDEEYQMQETWAMNEDKCTFILLDRAFQDTPGTGVHGGRMAGDVNLFFNDHDDHRIAEIEVMVAEPSSRGKGIASEALRIFMAYGANQLGVTKFRAKIGENNAASLSLFEKLGYNKVSHSEVFKEVTLELPVEKDTQRLLLEQYAKVDKGSYDSP
jgi:RimJ/RimL family protein N-acetyltransferase